ncbi:MAG: hypothetical protein LBH93_03750 [Chitinispirillales bacterium]|jgi:hypothetical protein|nr:hypothetical protein [Chitinispirillales bacterium]
MYRCALRGVAVPLALAAAILCACAEGDAVIRNKLDIILNDDLEAILEDVSPEALIEKPLFDMTEYRKYSEGAYTRMAIVDFYFLKPAAATGTGMKIRRKYRYHRRLGMWDRYYNKYYSFTPEGEAAETGGAPDN